MSDSVSGRSTGQTYSWYTHSLERSNSHCLYCGVFLRGPDSPPSDKEHLIARNFVPTGTMGNQAFNFLFRACRECNARKAAAERHVSSVTLFNSPSRVKDVRANDAAIRKGQNDFHPNKLGTPIQDSHERFSISGSNGLMSMSIGMTAPPRLGESETFEVALSHIQGLFSLLCTQDHQDPAKLRLLPPEQFTLHRAFTYNDWGHPHLLELARRVSPWKCYANIVSAGGFFKAILRQGTDCWFWALEWNQQMRVVGGISLGQMTVFDELPEEGWVSIPGGRMRKEIPYDACNDRLFTGDVFD